ncbi:MAG: protein DA1 [Bryobacteraceae bacterium]
MSEQAVERVAEARALFEPVSRWARELGMRFYGMPIQVRLRPARQAEAGKLGRTIQQRLWSGRKLLRNRIYGIEISRGLSPLRFQGVVAHELGHVWLAVHRIRLPLVLEEGFCELLAHRFYTDLGGQEARRYAQEIETNPDPIYGGGFRYVQRVLGPAGPERVLRERRLPLTIQHAPAGAVM